MQTSTTNKTHQYFIESCCRLDGTKETFGAIESLLISRDYHKPEHRKERAKAQLKRTSNHLPAGSSMSHKETRYNRLSIPSSGAAFMTLSQAVAAASDRTPVNASLNQLPGLDFHAEYQSHRTGGDFFDALPIRSRMMFLLTDIAGRAPLTLDIAARVQDTFRKSALQLFDAPDANLMDATAELIQQVNRALIAAAGGVCFAPTFIGCFDSSLGVLAYINAGGQPAVFRDSDSTRLLPNVDVPMGLFTHLIYEPSVQAFEPGAKLLVVTKGIVECSRGRKHFGVDRVIAHLRNSSTKSAAEICRTTLDAACDFRRLPWYSIQHLLPGKRRRDEDLTALALVRPLAP